MPNRFRLATVAALFCASLLIPTAASSAGERASLGPAKRAVKAHTAVGTRFVSQAPVRARAAQDCPDADLDPAPGNELQLRAAILCLHNQIRAERGLPLLRENKKLRRAAVAHSTDMVSRRFFDHTAPGGVGMVDRIFAARYVPRGAGWSLGENLAWGTGDLGTPRGIMRAWMDSPGHKANVVKRSYRDIGIGVVTGVPSGGNGGATYTADFGTVRR